MKHYVIIFKKYFISRAGKIQYNSHFCTKSLKSDSIKRRFDGRCSDIVENMIVKKGKKIIYEGNDYKEFMKVAERLEK